MTENGSPFDFPCDIPVKVFGRNDDSFRDAVVELVSRYFPEFDPADRLERPSRKDSYLSITVTLWVESQEQIDALYRALSSHDAILMAL